jgi:glycosyltransferase involved in cell wall biosynthesis
MNPARKEFTIESLSANVLIFYLGPRTLYRSTIVSENEIFCSPHCETQTDRDCFVCIQTPSGVFDISEITRQLPRSQHPELIVVKADATGGNFPVNLRSLNCPTLLICGNTQHLSQPLQTLVKYAVKEQFDFIASDHKRHHLHYFKEAGFERVFWLPAFNINPHPPQANLPIQYSLSFVGQVGRFHPYRQYILSQLKTSNFPLNQLQAPPERAAEIYAQSQINLNISLNGDLNLRVFEVLASGGFLLTDRLSDESGLNSIFKPGTDLEVFNNLSDLKYQIRYFLEHPQETAKIARNGKAIFWENYRPEINIQRMFNYLNGQQIDPIYQIESDRRTVWIGSDCAKDIYPRLAIYEYFQELHLNQPNIRILFWPRIDAKIICDAVDLPRLEIAVISDDKSENTSFNPLLARCGIHDRISWISSLEQKQAKVEWDAIVLTWSELKEMAIDDILETFNFNRLLITDIPETLLETNFKLLENLLDRRGFIKDSENPIVYRWQRKSDWGNWLLSQQNLRAAIPAFERALQDNSEDITAAIELGRLYFELNDLKSAETLLQHAVSLQRRHPLALEYFARLLITQNCHLRATEVLKTLILIKPEYLSGWSLLEQCYRQIGKEEKALQVYRHCRKLKESKTLTERAIAISESEESIHGDRVATIPLKRILVINNLYPPQELGGYGRSLFDFANLLRQRGHTVQVLTSDAPYLGRIRENEPYVNRNLQLFGSFEGETKPIEDPTEIERIVHHNHAIVAETIEQFSPEVCLIGNINFLGTEIFNDFLENSIPIIHHLGLPTLLYPPQMMPQHRLFMLATASKFVMEKVKEQGYDRKNTAIVYPGAWVEKFKMCTIPNLDRLRIVYAGLIVGSKGPQTLVKALKILHDRQIDFECSFAGDTFSKTLFNNLKEFVNRYGMNDKIEFIGYLKRQELIELYSTKNVIVFPSIGPEAFGISPVEGMAAGLTAISTGVGGAREAIEDGVSGLLFPPEDAVALANQLLSLLDDKKRWRSLSRNGIERACTLLNIERSVDILEEKFEELVQHRNVDPQYLQNRILSKLSDRLHLREINVIIFPDWSQPEESISSQLEGAIRTVMTHPNSNRITLLIDSGSLAEEDVNLAISTVVMNLLMQEELEEVCEETKISVVGQLSELEWEVLLPKISGRLVIETENKAAIASTKIQSLQTFT